MDTIEVLSSEKTAPVHLPITDSLAKYFALVRRSLPLALKCLAAHGTPQLDKNIYEATVVSDMVQRLLNSCSALEMKFAFREDEAWAGQVFAGLEESGFPSYVDIDGIAVDLLHRDATLAEMRSDQAQLKKLILDCLIKDGREPRPILEELAKRTYLEMLDQRKVFLPYTEGNLIPWQVGNKEKGVRGYLYSWGTYSVAHNCPFVHLMYLTQDESEQPFEDGGDNLANFLSVMKDEGSHVPDKLRILAVSIDDRLDPIHPKVLKRVRIGPLRSPYLINARPIEKLSDAEKAVKKLFDRVFDEDDFEMTFSQEMTFSKGQISRKKYLFSSVKQEIFFVPQLDEEGDMTRYILMPHRGYQEILPDEAKCIPHFARRVKFSYDHKKENVNEVS
jgi:hypothetical protein